MFDAQGNASGAVDPLLVQLRTLCDPFFYPKLEKPPSHGHQHMAGWSLCRGLFLVSTTFSN